MAAVLSCGPDAVLSHGSAAAHWGIRRVVPRVLHVSVPAHVRRHGAGLVVHPRKLATEDLTEHRGIPVTTPICTLVDEATTLASRQLERAVNEADALDLVDPESLRAALALMGKRRGAGRLRRLLDERTFVLTDSDVERLFLPIARRAGLPKPLTRQFVNGFKVDFYWPELGLVVETDSLRYHRTPQQQMRDHLRDQAHFAAKLLPLRFTHYQLARTKRHVEVTLRAVAPRR
jgi:very-short-patch-repair endonuclease